MIKEKNQTPDARKRNLRHGTVIETRVYNKIAAIRLIDYPETSVKNEL